MAHACAHDILYERESGGFQVRADSLLSLNPRYLGNWSVDASWDEIGHQVVIYEMKTDNTSNLLRMESLS